MRLFETLLVLSVLLIALVQFLYSFKYWRAKDENQSKANINQIRTLGVVSGILFLIHFLFEGIRWQLYYIYLYLIFVLVITFLLDKRLIDNRRGLKTLVEFLNIFPLIISVFLAWVLPVPKIIEPTGEYHVGRIEKHIIIEDRLNGEVFSILSDLDKNAKRELMITLWYPTNEKGKDTSWFLLEDKTTPTRMVINYLNKNFGLEMPTKILNHAFFKEKITMCKTGGNPYPFTKIIFRGLGYAI